MAKNLTPSQVEALMNRDGRHRVAPNLYLSVRGNAQNWVFRYQRGTQQIWMGLGACHVVTFEEAREAARDNLRLIQKGIDPLAEKRREVPSGTVPTFEEAAVIVIAALKPGWRNAKHSAQWESSLATYAFPRLGRLPVNQITMGDVEAILKPIWATKNETASRVRGRIEQILSWCKAQGFVSGDNPASCGYL